MKSLLFFLGFQLVCIVAFAQTHSVSGNVLDSRNKDVIVGAHVILKSKITKKAFVLTSDVKGGFYFDEVPKGAYTLHITFIGYSAFLKDIVIENSSVHLGDIQLKSGVKLSQVNVTAQLSTVVHRGDTTEINALAYKTLPDASAEDLIEKMPTVVIDNGTLQAEGEDVKQVLVDGRPFFGQDPQAAIKNIPAEVIDKIQIFDKQSEQAQFTGFDDGNSEKTINIVTKVNMRNGTFGKIYAGYGYENKYSAGGNISWFNGDRRVSLVGMLNNVNQQNFSSEDLLGVMSSSKKRGGRRGGSRGGGSGGPGGNGGGKPGDLANDFMVAQQGGITASTAIGFNYSDKWNDNIDITASYFFNQSDNKSEQLTKQQYYNSEGLQEIYEEENSSESTNINHRLNATLRYELDDKNSFVFLPRLTWQGNNGEENTVGLTSYEGSTLNQLNNTFNADLSALNFNNFLLWKHKMNKSRRTFSAGVNYGYSPERGENSLLTEDVFNGDVENSLIQQTATLDQNKWNLSANVQYTEPIGERSMLMFNYKASYQQEEIEKETYDFDVDLQEYDVLNTELSNVFANDYFTQEVGAGFNFRYNRSFMLMLRAGIQKSDLLNEQRSPYSANFGRSYLNVIPKVMLHYRISNSERIRVHYDARTELPSIDNLQNVVDNSNPLQLNIGNPGLDQSTTHKLRLHYSNINRDKSSVFFAMLAASYTDNYVANSTYLSANELPFELGIEPVSGAQVSRPVNLDGAYNVRSFVTYGFPVAALKSNLNIDLTGNYQRVPGLIDEQTNMAETSTLGAGLTFSSNIASVFDFTLSSRSNYNIAENSLQAASNTTYFNQNTKLKLNVILNNGFVFRSTFSHQYYDGLSDDFNQNYLLVNASIGTKIFKNKRGEISLSVYDLLNQNTSVTRNVTETYTEDVQTNTLQQYAMINFRYDLRQFKVSDEDRKRSEMRRKMHF